jgi:hypothetical protein
MLRYFGTSLFITIAAVIVAFVALGPAAALTTIILIAIEIAFSFDNAIINAKILAHLSKVWQQLFLTIGMIVAIVGMRFVFPILIVMVTAHLGWDQVIDDALHHPKVYGEHLEEAHAAISAFGGAFLLTLTMYFLFDDARDVLWLHRIERPLQRIGGSFWLPPVFVAIVVGLVALFAGSESSTVLRAGMIGVASYAGIKLFIDGIGKVSGQAEVVEEQGISKKPALYTGWAAFLAFMYLQVLDASFSFDGVLGAFAITDKILLIALGLGVGALWVRSLTVFMVRKGTLDEYQYLEHGAHYAILVLAVALLTSIFYEIPDAVTGISGLGVIGASYYASVEAIKHRHARH